MKRPLAQIQALIRELRRRQVIRVAVVYATTAFVILQLGEILVEPFGLGDWALRFVLFLLVLGFPLALGLAWVYNLTEEGVVREVREETAGGEAASEGSPLTSNRLIVGLLIVAIGLLAYPRMFSSGEGPADQGAPAAPDTARVGERSIAVLPFEPLSSGEKSKTFAQGVHDDLLTRLANISDLKVISRTAVQQYRNTDLTTEQIADSLGVRWVMEGGVQVLQDQIQVTAQLINPRTETHRWADDYQRDLTAEDLFAIQGEITAEIADALKAELTAGEQNRVTGAPTENLKAYRLYVKGRSALNRRTEEGTARALTYFQRAIKKDSTYALAWAGLSDAIWISRSGDWGLEADSIPDPETAARRALKLGPDLAEAHAAMGHFYRGQRNLRAAQKHLKRAVQLKPSYAEGLKSLGGLHYRRGRLEEALKLYRLAVEVNPEHSEARFQLYAALLATGRYEEALRQARQLQERHPERFSGSLLVLAALTHLKRWDEARKLARRSQAEGARADYENAFLALADVAQGDTSRARKRLRRLKRQQDVHPVLLGAVYGALGEPKAALSAWQRWEITGNPFAHGLIRYFYPDLLGPLREHPGYEDLIRKHNRHWGLNPDGTIPEKSPSSTSPNTDA